MALHTAIKRGDIDQVRELLQSRSNYTDKDEHKRTVLHIAASNGSVELFELLYSKSKRIDINAQDDRGWTPLHFATSKGHYKLCRHIIKYKNIKISVANEERNTPFLYLCKLSLDTSDGSDSVVQYYRTLVAFYSKGVDLNERNKQGESPLHCAARCGNPEAVNFLCRKGVDVNVVNK